MTKQITTVLIDLSGTLHIDNAIVPGAVQALNRYRLFTFLMSNCYVRVYIHMCACVYICHAYTFTLSQVELNSCIHTCNTHMYTHQD